jgi:putative phosphoribosyl transferase
MLPSMPDIKINLDDIPHAQTLDGNLAILAIPKAIIIFAHGSGSGKDSPRNRHVAKMLNDNGFATLLVDLLTLQEQESDIKNQSLMGKYPGILLNKFNIFLLSNRLTAITKWLIANKPEVMNLP